MFKHDCIACNFFQLFVPQDLCGVQHESCNDSLFVAMLYDTTSSGVFLISARSHGIRHSFVRSLTWRTREWSELDRRTYLLLFFASTHGTRLRNWRRGEGNPWHLHNAELPQYIGSVPMASLMKQNLRGQNLWAASNEYRATSSFILGMTVHRTHKARRSGCDIYEEYIPFLITNSEKTKPSHPLDVASALILSYVLCHVCRGNDASTCITPLKI